MLLRSINRFLNYGSGGILLGYRDTGGFEKVANTRDKIDYLFSIPNKWIQERVAEKDNAGNTVIPNFNSCLHYSPFQLIVKRCLNR